MLKFCDFCNKEYDFETHMHWMSHKGNCEFNPNRIEANKKLSKLFSNKRKKREFVCSCGKKYVLFLTDYIYEKGKYRKHCSRTCANKKRHSKKTKLKIANSLKDIKDGKGGRSVYKKICLYCLKEFEAIKKNQRFCNKSCSTSFRNKNTKLSDETKRKLSESLKKQYKNGRQNYAGWAKWYELDTSIGKIKVQGTYEVKAVEILEKWKLENKIRDWEYTKDIIEYIGEDKKKHVYILDFKVFENNEEYYYIETKGYKTKKDVLKWKAAREQEINLKIWYKKELFNET